MRKSITALLTGAMLMMATSAMALTYTSSLADLLNYTVLGSTSLAAQGLPYADGTGGAYFNPQFSPAPLTDAYVAYGLTFSTPLDLTGYDTFSLSVENVNENTWFFGLFMGTPDVNSTPQAININTMATINLDLTSISASDLASIDALGLYVTSDVPIVGANGKNDYQPEFTVAPVPEPGTMLLLGIGMLGMAVYGKRRMNK